MIRDAANLKMRQRVGFFPLISSLRNYRSGGYDSNGYSQMVRSGECLSLNEALENRTEALEWMKVMYMLK